MQGWGETNKEYEIVSKRNGSEMRRTRVSGHASISSPLILPMSLISASGSSSSPPAALSAASFVANRCTYSTVQQEETPNHDENTLNRHKVRDGGLPFTLASYSFGWRISRAAASPFRGSFGFGYRSSWGRKVSKIFIISRFNDQAKERGKPTSRAFCVGRERDNDSVRTKHRRPRLIDNVEADRAAPAEVRNTVVDRQTWTARKSVQ